MMRCGTALLLVIASACSKGGEATLPSWGTGGALAAAVPSTGERVAELYLSTEVAGYIEPCGCTTTPLGGIQRLATVLGRGRSARALLDAGDLLFPSEPITDATRDQHRLKARVLARMYRQLGAVALNVGPTDLAMGPEFLEELQREGAVPLLSTNVRPVADQGPAIAQSFVREIGGIKVGVLGVARPEALPAAKGLAAVEYSPAVRAEQHLLRKRGAELIVVLAHVGDQGAEDLAREVPEIDVIVRAPGTPIGTRPAPPRRVGPVTIVEAGSQGQHIGRLTLRFGAGAPGRPLVLDDAAAQAEAQRELGAKKLRAYRAELSAWASDPTKAEIVTMKRGQIAKLERELAAPPAAIAAQPVGSIRFELIALSDAVPADATATDVLAAYYAELRGLNLDKGDLAACAAQPGKPTFVGADACKTCHAAAYALWRTTAHGRAWATLEKQNKHFDLTCVGCHTAGYEQPGGFCRLRDVGPLVDVGCENCHGPGSAHVVSGDKTKINRDITEATCAKSCHVPAHSDAFAYAVYLPKILGPGHQAKKAAAPR